MSHTREEAEEVVEGWLSIELLPLRKSLSKSFSQLQTLPIHIFVSPIIFTASFAPPSQEANDDSYSANECES